MTFAARMGGLDPALAVPLMIVVLVVVIVIGRSVRVVPAHQAAVIERLGKFHRVAGPGLAFAFSFTDRVRSFVDLRDTVIEAPRRPHAAEGGGMLDVNALMTFRVVRPEAFAYSEGLAGLSGAVVAGIDTAPPIPVGAGATAWAGTLGRSLEWAVQPVAAQIGAEIVNVRSRVLGP